MIKVRCQLSQCLFTLINAHICRNRISLTTKFCIYHLTVNLPFDSPTNLTFGILTIDDSAAILHPVKEFIVKSIFSCFVDSSFSHPIIKEIKKTVNVVNLVFIIFLFHLDDFSCSQVALQFALTVYGMVSCGITRQFPISLHLPFLRATNAQKPLKPACTIPCVVSMCIFISVYKLLLILQIYNL
jgi:hypothetical protein